MQFTALYVLLHGRRRREKSVHVDVPTCKWDRLFLNFYDEILDFRRSSSDGTRGYSGWMCEIFGFFSG